MRAAILAHRDVAPLLLDNHVLVDGRLVKAYASMKCVPPKAANTHPNNDPGSPIGPDRSANGRPEPTRTRSQTDPMPRPTRQNRNAEVDFRGKKRSNAARASTTEPDAGLYRKSLGTGAMLCFTGHALVESRWDPIVQGEPTQGRGPCRTTGGARHDPPPFPRIGPATDARCGQGFDAAGFVADLRHACGTPYVSQQSRCSAIDGRTTRHKGYALSIKHRERIEEAFGWARSAGRMAQTVHCGVEPVRPRFIMTMAPTTLPSHPGCWLRDGENRRPAGSSRETEDTKLNAKGYPDRKPLLLTDFKAACQSGRSFS